MTNAELDERTDVGDRSRFEIAVRWVVSGALGFSASYVLFEVLFRSLPEGDARPTVAWVTSYSLGVLVQHALHRWLVFGLDTPYWLTLRRSAVVYLTSLAGAAGLNVLIVRLADLDYRLVWLLTVAAMSFLNYLALKTYAFRR